MTSKIISALVIASALALGACAKKQPLPDNAGALGIGQGAGAGAGAGGTVNGVARGSAQDFTVNVGDRIFFTTDSTSLTAKSRATLVKQARWLQQYPNYSIVVEGHADERGTREYNLSLGARRAAATRSFLSAQGVSRSRMQTTSFGKERPVATCDDISCWSQNRRAVTVVK